MAKFFIERPIVAIVIPIILVIVGVVSILRLPVALMGLVLAIGLVVDDAIWVVEAVEHHIEKGLSPKEATRKAMEGVSGPVIAIALVLSAVFLYKAMGGRWVVEADKMTGPIAEAKRK